MEIILLEKIQNLGDLGDLVKVKNGFARNYLIPQKKAVRASNDAKTLVAERRRLLAAENSKRIENAKARAELAIREIVVYRLCSEEGKLYGSVTEADIAETMSEAGTMVEKAEISLPDGSIKSTGEFAADVTLHPEVTFSVKITVASQEDSGSSSANDEIPQESAQNT